MIVSRVRAFLRSRRPCAASTTFFTRPVCPAVPTVNHLPVGRAMPHVTPPVFERALTFGSVMPHCAGMTSFLHRLGRACVRRRRLVVLAWALLAIAAVGLGQASGGRTSDAFEIPGVESQQAYDVL